MFIYSWLHYYATFIQVTEMLVCIKFMPPMCMWGGVSSLTSPSPFSHLENGDRLVTRIV